MSKLIEHQILFTYRLGQLLTFIRDHEYRVTLGEVWRNPDVQALYVKTGRSWTQNSRHLVRLAVDLNLILSDGSLAKDADDYRPLGEFWESLDPACRWGGNFKHRPPDDDHFEMTPPTELGAVPA